MGIKTCLRCGKEFRNKSPNPKAKYCISCNYIVRGTIKTRYLKDKKAKQNKDGYLYYDQGMCTREEISLVGATTNWRVGNKKNGTVLVHRLIVAQSLGRPLSPGEFVRHINGNKLDNRLENLQLGTVADNNMDNRTAILEMNKWRNIAMNLFAVLQYQEQQKEIAESELSVGPDDIFAGIADQMTAGFVKGITDGIARFGL